jgi:branched-chain amino acid transport system substrate-binding protein
MAVQNLNIKTASAEETTMTRISRRAFTKAAVATAATGPISRFAIAQQANTEIVIGAGMPLTGVFAFPGASLHAGLGDFCAWKNASGGVMGRKLRYVAEDTSFKIDQAVAVFKKITASEKPNFYYGDRTETSKAIAQEAAALGNLITAGPSMAVALADAKEYPYHFISGPTYGSMHEVLMESIARGAKSGDKPKVALVYTETEFGTDGIPASKARAEKLGLPIVAEIITKQAGFEVASEVAKLRRAKPDWVIFQGYILNPLPEFVRQMREGGLDSQIGGTVWSMDRTTYEAMAAVGVSKSGVTPYRYAFESESTMMKAMKDYVDQTRPGFKGLSFFYINAWLSGMIFAEIAERCIKADKPFTAQNMKAALESITNWDTGGLTGLPVDLSTHQIKSGRMYRYDLDKKEMAAASDWIRV